MFSNKVTDTDEFLDMPHSAQCLYFHLSMQADDDGFVSNPKKVKRSVNSSDDDLKILTSKQFVIPFESGVCVIRHWRINNYIRSDRYEETQYQDEKKQLNVAENGMYTTGIPNANQSGVEASPQVRLGKVRLGKERLGKERKGKSREQSSTTHYESQDYYLASYLLDEIRKNNPTFKEPNLEKWAEHVRLMRERDGRTYEQIEFLIGWAQKNTFWQANILSTKKLREKFDTLVAQVKREVTSSEDYSVAFS